MTAQLESLPVVRDGQMGALLMIGDESAWMSQDDIWALLTQVRQKQTDRMLDEEEGI